MVPLGESLLPAPNCSAVATQTKRRKGEEAHTGAGTGGRDGAKAEERKRWWRLGGGDSAGAKETAA